MKTNRGKGYFYAMGQRDETVYGKAALHYLLRVKGGGYPDWARIAYYHGFNGWGL